MVDPWNIAGDFNTILHGHEKRKGSENNARGNSEFFELIDESHLMEINSLGSKGMWKKDWIRC